MKFKTGDKVKVIDAASLERLDGHYYENGDIGIVRESSPGILGVAFIAGNGEYEPYHHDFAWRTTPALLTYLKKIN